MPKNAKRTSRRFFEQVDRSTDPATAPRPTTTTTVVVARTPLLPPTGCPSTADQAKRWFLPRILRGNRARLQGRWRFPALQRGRVRSATYHLSLRVRLRGKVVSITSDLHWIHWRQLSRLVASPNCWVGHSSITLLICSRQPPWYELTFLSLSIVFVSLVVIDRLLKNVFV